MELNPQSLAGPCPCGREHRISAHDILLEPDALEKLPRLLAAPFYQGWEHPVVVCDENTYEAAGRRACALLPQARPVVLPAENLHADEHGVARLIERLPGGCGGLLAVGSGTIHDITRFVGAQKSIPFISVPTAASVDGFVSSVAAMTWGGYKKTFPSVPPVAVVADSAVIARAPDRLTRAGMGDLLGKFIALTDWKIACLVTGEYFCDRICRMEEQAVETVLRLGAGCPFGDTAACEKLMYGLLLSGFAMQMTGNSRPASGAEHHCSHLWEMEILSPHTDALHGEKVGVGTLLTARAYHAAEAKLRGGAFSLPPYSGPGEEWEELARLAGPARLPGFESENTPDPLATVDAGRLEKSVPAIARLLRAVPEEHTLQTFLQAAGAKCTLEDIGLAESLREPTLRFSPYVRRRLTFMRLLKRFRFA